MSVKTNKSAFSIVANVAFEIPKFLAGAFNAYHIGKGRLTKAGKVGRVTAEGAKFFTLREGEAPTAKSLAAFAETCKTAKYPLTEKGGVTWPVGPNAIAWQAGQGQIGQSAFFYALCELTQAAQKVAQVTKPAVKQADKKPASVTASKAKPASKAKAKPVTVTA